MTDGAENPDELLALLAWWREAGVDYALDETPVDWSSRGDAPPGQGFVWPGAESGREGLRQPAGGGGRGAVPGEAGHRPQAPPARREVAREGGQRAPAPPGRARTDAAAATRAAARKAATLEALEALLSEFEGCPLKATAKNLCFYRGTPNARLMIIGEAPGRDEDIAGKPFVGRAGQLLDRMLAAIGLSEADVHITNVVYWRPPGNRTPTPEEAEACRPFIERQMELVAPDVILTLGGPAAKAILQVTEGIMRLRGKWREIDVGGRSVPVMPTLHPAYLLRQPQAKRQAWRDLLALKIRLDDLAKGKSR